MIQKTFKITGMELEIVYTDTTPLPRGKYQFTSLNRVPPEYLLQIYKNKDRSDKALFEYIEKNLEAIKARVGNFIVVKPYGQTCNKIAYATRKAARDALKDIRNHDQEHKKPIRTYECEFCSFWHLTSLTVEEWREKMKKTL
jgi:uncharacterized protein (DUF3820 family)